MSSSMLTQAAIIVAVAVGGAFYLAEKSDVESDPAIPGPALSAPTVTTPKVAPKVKPQMGSVVSIPRTNGQFFAQGQVNSGSVRFLVDTGASVVALTVDDAKRAGIDVRKLTYDRPVDTANGRTMAAAVRLDDVRIGGVRVSNVPAMVLSEGLHVSLLGMSFLGELQKVEATPNQLILRR